MTIVYGNQIEPGGMLLDDDESECNCPECGKPEAIQRIWEQNDGGCINQYHRLTCHACGYSVGNNDVDESNDEFVDYAGYLAQCQADEEAWLIAERKRKLNPVYWVKAFARRVHGVMFLLYATVKDVKRAVARKIPDQLDRKLLRNKLEYRLAIAAIDFKYKANISANWCKYKATRLTAPVLHFAKYELPLVCLKMKWKIRSLPRQLLLLPFWLIKVVVVFLVPRQTLRNFGAWVLTRQWVRRKLRELLNTPIAA